MNYYYSQRDKRWAKMKLGQSQVTMEQYGCVVTGCAMLLSYYQEQQVLPSDLVDWLSRNKGFNLDGELYWKKICEFSNNSLRFSLSPNPKKGELTFGIRKISWGGGHWVVDHPQVAGKIIDPWTGWVKDYNYFTYVDRNRFFLGIRKAMPVDNRYAQKRTWASFMQEKKMRFYWIPGSPAAYIHGKIHRPITDRETNALVYGKWDFAAVFENRVGDTWLSETKPFYDKSR